MQVGVWCAKVILGIEEIGDVDNLDFLAVLDWLFGASDEELRVGILDVK